MSTSKTGRGGPGQPRIAPEHERCEATNRVPDYPTYRRRNKHPGERCRLRATQDVGGKRLCARHARCARGEAQPNHVQHSFEVKLRVAGTILDYRRRLRLDPGEPWPQLTAAARALGVETYAELARRLGVSACLVSTIGTLVARMERRPEFADLVRAPASVAPPAPVAGMVA